MNTVAIRISLLGIAILGITFSHYLTPLNLHFLHDLLQRFYYLPIILAAIWFGLRGGLLCALVVSIAYVPHILFQWGGGLVIEIEKYLEIVMYNVVGGVTGLLAQRERERSGELQRTAEGLADSYARLQSQSEQIIAIEEQLRRAERLSTLGEMAAVLAHEVRNPLASLRGSAEILRDDYPPGSHKHEFLEMQVRETERLNRVVEDFLKMSRHRAAELGPCHLREELETVITLTAGDARRRQVSLQLAPFEGDPLLHADGDKLRQAFLNIIINALQATPAGGGVTITLQSDPFEHRITFSDTGCGIDSAAMERIFEPFFTTRGDGTGLGLAVTRKIIEAHGGSVVVESRFGEGTKVLLILPAGKENI